MTIPITVILVMAAIGVEERLEVEAMVAEANKGMG